MMWPQLASLLGGNIFEGISKIIGQFKIDPTVAAQIQAEFQKAQMDWDARLSEAQNQVNAAEAASGDKFASRWRPAAGWLGVLGLAYAIIVDPMLTWASTNFHIIPPPSLDTGVLVTLLMGMLGLGGMRTYEKVQGVTK